MAGSAILSIKILTDASQAQRGLKSAATSMDKFKSGVRKAAVPAALVGAAILKFGNDAVQSASRTQQAFGGVDAVFGKNADTVKKWADSAAGSIGLAKSEYGELATLIGSQLSNAGLPLDVVTKKTGALIQQGADLAAMFGGTTADAVGALSSAMKGEFDPLEKYGTSLSAAKIKAEMVAQGTDKLSGKAADQAKTMATLALITKQTAKAHGAAAREQDTYAARTQQFAAEIENLKSDLGTALLPIIAAVVGKLAGLARWMAKNQTAAKIIVGVIAVLVVAILALNVALTITEVVSAALNATWLPVAAVVVGIALAIAALIVVVVILYKKFPIVKKVIDGAWNGVKAATRALVAVFRAQFATMLKVVQTVARVVKAAWSKTMTGLTTATRAVGRFLSTVFVAPVRAAMGVIRGLGHLAASVMEGIRSAVGRVAAAFGTVASRIKGAFAGAGRWLFSIGASIVQGLIDGIGSLMSWVRGKVEALAALIPKWARKKLGIASPSKVMKVIGRDVSRGLAKGITEGSAAVVAVSKRVADLVAATMTAQFKNKRQAATATRAVISSLDDEYRALKKNADRRKTVTDSIKNLRSQMSQWAQQVTGSAKQFAGLTAAVDLGEGVALTAGNLTAAMADRVGQVEQFTALLTALRKAGLAQSAIDELAQQGVEGGLATAQAIAAGGPGAVRQINILQSRLNAAAGTLGKRTAGWMQVAGGKSASAYLDGLLTDQRQIESAARRFAKALTKAIRKALATELAKKPLPVKGKPGKAGGQSIAPVTTRGRVGSAPAASSTTTVNVYGAIDPEGTARTVRRVLEGHDRRVGLRVS